MSGAGDARTRDLLLSSARAARAIGVWNHAAIAGWMLEMAEGDAAEAMLLDAPVHQADLGRARSHLLAVLAEEKLVVSEVA